MPDVASQCAVCHGWPARQVCDSCVARFSPMRTRCTACALALPADLTMGERRHPGVCAECLVQPPPVNATLVAVDYAYPWSELLTRYKFGNRPGWAAFFAALLLEATAVRSAFAALRPGDFILAMPLSAQRLQSRGFNQAWELASALASQSGSQGDAAPDMLLRVKHTQPQTELRREARLANVKGVFQLDPLRAPAVAGRQVILVDDVMTSGASLFTAASVLRAAGAVHVAAVAIARTAAP